MRAAISFFMVRVLFALFVDKFYNPYNAYRKHLLTQSPDFFVCKKLLIA